MNYESFSIVANSHFWMRRSIIALFFLLFFTTGSLFGKEDWPSYKSKTVQKMAKIKGWCTEEKAQLMMDLIRENDFQTCVEIGVFAGKSLFPIAKALKYIGAGRLYAIDPWDPIEVLKNFKEFEPQYEWWKKIDFNLHYEKTLKLIKKNKLSEYCTIIKRSSDDAAEIFSEGTIDFIHFDGNHNENSMIQDVLAYFPKVKDKGYILLTDPNWICARQALVYLLERADVISPFIPSATYLLFRKNDQKEKTANALINKDI